jgi:epoxyqueuosine reductase
MKKKNYDQLRKFCSDLGLDLFGVADITGVRSEFTLSKAAAEKFPFAVCVGAALSRGVFEDINDHPTRPYFHHYKTANMFLDQAAFRIAAYIEKKGYAAFPVAASQILDWEKQTGLLSHKHVARLAGLGWIGRNNLLVNKKLGSRFRIATILTDLPLSADTPVSDSCGACRCCISVCPAGAIKEKPEDFDHQACFDKLKEFQKLRYTEQYICGVCIRACAGKSATRGSR